MHAAFRSFVDVVSVTNVVKKKWKRSSHLPICDETSLNICKDSNPPVNYILFLSFRCVPVALSVIWLKVDKRRTFVDNSVIY